MDERENKISGSGMAGYALCAGKWNAEANIPKGLAGEAAEIGTRIHEYIASGKGNLSTDEVEIADLIVNFYKEAIDNINAGDITDTVLERRYWYGDDWSGQIDRLDFIGDTTAIVTDYKTGRVAQGRAQGNMQLRSYAVLVKRNFPNLKRIFVCIIQPLAGPTTIAEYNEDSLCSADNEICRIVAEAYKSDAPRTPSPDSCKYCRAKSTCPEARSEASVLAQVPLATLPAMSNDQLSYFLEKTEIVEDLIVAIKAEAKERLKAGQEISGYQLGAGRTTRSITNPNEAYSKLQSVLDPNQFASVCKVSVPELEKAVANQLMLKAKEGKQKLAELLGETIETKTSEPVMTRVK